MKKLISVDSKIQADEIVALLKSYSINSHTTSNGAGEYFNIAYNFSLLGENIFVSEEDFDNAKLVIERLEPFNSIDFSDDYALKKHRLKRRTLSIIILILFGGAILFGIFQSLMF